MGWTIRNIYEGMGLVGSLGVVWWVLVGVSRVFLGFLGTLVGILRRGLAFIFNDLSGSFVQKCFFVAEVVRRRVGRGWRAGIWRWAVVFMIMK